VKSGSFYQKSVNIGEFEDIGRFQILALKIGRSGIPDWFK
jgi:hypothetical protein